MAENTKNTKKTESEELVEVRLFKDSEKYKDDVFVAVNGESCLIRRGETVKIKKKFAKAIENAVAQQEYAAKLNENIKSNYNNRQEGK